MANAGAGDSNLLRIMISTDNHLGVWEKDEARRDDSFRAFEEVLQLAVATRADMVLLGGDLFHDNAPSRATLVRAIQLLSRYCLGDSPVRFRVLSDQSKNFVVGRVNFESPHLNIGLPVFAIHGNHDDPAGQDCLSAVDILSQTGLVNYFGKHPLTGTGAATITLSPVLIEKGTTRLCLYGLGNIRDERLGRAFQTPGCVQWQRPAPAPAYPPDSWVNMFVLHQNRVQHSPLGKACVREEHLPPFLDLVVWGHEHECRPDPVPLRGEGEGRYVVQPGSTVATALSEGESRPKHALLLEVLGCNFRLTKHRLRSVRPFEFESVALRDAVPPLLPEDAEGVARFLTGKVNEMITRAGTAQLALPSPTDPDPPADPSGGPSGPLLPLIRLRVDYTGYATVNSQRLGQRFVGRVANPHDMLQWSKAAARRVKSEGDPGAAGRYGDDDEGFLRPELLDQSRMEDLIRQHMGARALEVLPDDELGIALQNFVEKDDKNALLQCIDMALEETRAATLASALAEQEAAVEEGQGAGGPGGGVRVKKAGGQAEEELAGAVRMGVERRRQQRQQQVAVTQHGEDEGVDLAALGAGVTEPYGTGHDDDGDETMAEPPTGRRAAAGRTATAAARTGPSQAAAAATPIPKATTTTGRGRGGRGGARGAGRQQSLMDSLARGTGSGRGGGGGPTSQATSGGGGVGGPLDSFLQPSLPAGASGGTPGPGTTPAGRRGGGRGGRATRGLARTHGAVSPSAAFEDDVSDVEMTDAADGGRRIEDEDDIEDEEAPGPRGRAAAGAKGRRGGGRAGRGGTGGSVARGRTTRTVARKNYQVDDDDEELEDASDGAEDIEDEQPSSDEPNLEDEMEEEEERAPARGARGGRTRAASGRGGGSRGGAAAGAGSGRGRGAAAASGGSRTQQTASRAAAAAQSDVITLTSDDDDEPGPSLGPPAARAHAAAGAAYLSAAPLATNTTPSVTQGATGGSGAAPTGTAAGGAGGARKRPASFFTSGAATQGRGGAGAGRGWGQAR